jgi:two-component system invasion response regulator UvrY
MLAAQSAHLDHADALSIVVIGKDRLLLESLPDNRGPLAGISFVGRTSDPTGSCELIRRMAPRVVLLDGPCFIFGFRAVCELVELRVGQTRTAVLADDLSDTQLELAASCGVKGLLSRSDSLVDLGYALRRVGEGRCHVSPNLAARATIGQRPERIQIQRRSQLGTFSNRQLEVLIALAEGKRVKDIADELHLSEKAIESHKYRLMNRLGIHDRVELCRWAIREGLIAA